MNKGKLKARQIMSYFFSTLYNISYALRGHGQNYISMNFDDFVLHPIESNTTHYAMCQQSPFEEY